MWRWKCKKIFIISDEDNKAYIDSYKIYYNNGHTADGSTKLYEVIIIIFGRLFFSLYKLFSFKLIETLTPLHKIFSYPLYYFCQKVFFVIVKNVQI